MNRLYSRSEAYSIISGALATTFRSKPLLTPLGDRFPYLEVILLPRGFSPYLRRVLAPFIGDGTVTQVINLFYR